ncbi:MAG: hypothetical protein K2I97_03695, partial [Alistipes sp.]|nr:hypothetical protein [Alistipes sp.]
TTPDPLSLHALLARMAEAGVDMGIMEVSSHALAQQRVSGVPFAGAVFTNLTQDHLDFHPDMESYFKAKARLFLELPRKDKALAINADDPWGRRLLELCPGALSYGLGRGVPGRRHLWGQLLASGTGGVHLRMRADVDFGKFRGKYGGGVARQNRRRQSSARLVGRCRFVGGRCAVAQGYRAKSLLYFRRFGIASQGRVRGGARVVRGYGSECQRSESRSQVLGRFGGRNRPRKETQNHRPRLRRSFQ